MMQIKCQMIAYVNLATLEPIENLTLLDEIKDFRPTPVEGSTFIRVRGPSK